MCPCSGVEEIKKCTIRQMLWAKCDQGYMCARAHKLTGTLTVIFIHRIGKVAARTARG